MMQFYTLAILLNIFSFSHASQQKPIPYAMDSYDKEFEKSLYADRARAANTQGFQGCINQKVCNFYGFYACTYSKEGLCDTCEFKQHPDRFYACVFCRRPYKKIGNWQWHCSSACDSTSVKDVLLKALMVKQEFRHRQALEIGIHNYLNNSQDKISRKFIFSFGESKHEHEVFGFERPGIYKGAMKLENGNLLHIWSKKIQVDDEDKKLVTDWDEAEKHIAYIGEKYNIFGPETGTITLQQKPDDAYFTYEELVNKEADAKTQAELQEKEQVG